MDFTRWHNRYCIDSRLKYPSIKTQENYQCSVGTYLKFFIDKPDPQHISNLEIKEWLLTFDSINTRNHKLCAIKSFYQLTVGMPLKLDKIPFSKKEQKLPQPLSEQEVKLLFDNCDNIKHKTILSLLFFCGLRVGEVIGLRPEHIDRSNMVIRVISGKGRKDRQAPMSELVLKLLERYYREYRPKVFMFNGQLKDQYSERSINEFMKTIGKKAGIKKNLHSHLGRHSCFSQMLSNGIDMAIIQSVAGHNKIETTRIYAKVTSSLINRTTPYNFAI